MEGCGSCPTAVDAEQFKVGYDSKCKHIVHLKAQCVIFQNDLLASNGMKKYTFLVG